jgi:hypothetical protein
MGKSERLASGPGRHQSDERSPADICLAVALEINGGKKSNQFGERNQARARGRRRGGVWCAGLPHLAHGELQRARRRRCQREPQRLQRRGRVLVPQEQGRVGARPRVAALQAELQEGVLVQHALRYDDGGIGPPWGLSEVPLVGFNSRVVGRCTFAKALGAEEAACCRAQARAASHAGVLQHRQSRAFRGRPERDPDW